MAARANWRAVRKHRSYTVDEASRVLGVAKGTVRRWLKDGLPVLAERRPRLILGTDLIAFLRTAKRKRQRCQIQQCFCFRCRTPREPAFGELEVVEECTVSARVGGLCGVCGTEMHKRVSKRQMPELRARATVTLGQDLEGIGGRRPACANDDFN